jgi:hypothetical protein
MLYGAGDSDVVPPVGTSPGDVGVGVETVDGGAAGMVRMYVLPSSAEV